MTMQGPESLETAALIGKPEADVVAAIRGHGMHERVMERDGESLMGTMEVRSDRVNLAIRDGVVIRAYIG